MKTKILLSALLAAFLPGAAMAMCPGKRDKTVSDCSIGESRDPVSGQCIKPVNS